MPDNLEISFWDLNDRLTETFERETFDLIHSRCVGPGIKKDRWNGYIRDIARLLRRGGWVQMAEYYYHIQSDNGRLTEEHSIYKWAQTYRAVMEHYLDRDPRVGRSLAEKLERAGLRDIHARAFQIPIGSWSTGEIGFRFAVRGKQTMSVFSETWASFNFSVASSLLFISTTA